MTIDSYCKVGDEFVDKETMSTHFVVTFIHPLNGDVTLFNVKTGEAVIINQYDIVRGNGLIRTYDRYSWIFEKIDAVTAYNFGEDDKKIYADDKSTDIPRVDILKTELQKVNIELERIVDELHAMNKENKRRR